MADDNEDTGEKNQIPWDKIITAVGGVTISALSAISGNKRAWAALNQKAKLSEQQADFNNNLALLENYQDVYFKMAAGKSESQIAQDKVTMYSNIVGVVVISVVGLGLVYLLKSLQV